MGTVNHRISVRELVLGAADAGEVRLASAFWLTASKLAASFCSRRSRSRRLTTNSTSALGSLSGDNDLSQGRDRGEAKVGVALRRLRQVRRRRRGNAELLRSSTLPVLVWPPVAALPFCLLGGSRLRAV